MQGEAEFDLMTTPSDGLVVQRSTFIVVGATVRPLAVVDLVFCHQQLPCRVSRISAVFEGLGVENNLTHRITPLAKYSSY